MTKRDKLSGLNPFGVQKNTGEERPTLRDIDAEIFGDLAKLDVGRVEVKPTRIFDIVPDTTQPRRVMPSIVRQHWNGDPVTLGNALALWLDIVNQERGVPFNLDEHLLLHDGTDTQSEISVSERAIGPLESAFLEVVRLAASIRFEGLTNPISVIRLGRNFRLETGERRWLAYHLLNSWTVANGGDVAQWEKIPARVMEEFSVWRQASENNARADLNAIAKARQFAVLLMDLLNREKGIRFAEISAFPRERAFYAQVADGELYRIPDGKAEMIVNAMGFKSANTIRKYRALLNLPDEIWELSDDLNWSEKRIRETVIEGDSNLIFHRAAYQAAQEGYRVPWGTDLPHIEKAAHPKAENVPSWERSLMRIRRIKPREIKRMDGSTRRRFNQYLDDLERWIAEMRTHL